MIFDIWTLIGLTSAVLCGYAWDKFILRKLWGDKYSPTYWIEKKFKKGDKEYERKYKTF